MDLLQHFHTEMQKHLGNARAIADKADEEGRGLTKEEHEQAAAELERVAEFKSKIQDEKDKQVIRDQVDGFARLQIGDQGVEPNPVREPAAAPRARTMGEALIASDGFKAWQAKWRTSGPTKFTTPEIEVPIPRVGRKAAGDPHLESQNTELFGTGGEAGALTTMFPLETPGFVQFPLTLADLLTTVPITQGNSASYPVVKTRTPLPTGDQVEGQAKEAAIYEFDVVSKALITKAGYVKVSNQFLEDAPGLAAYINADLPLQVRQREEEYLAEELYTGSVTFATGAGLDAAAATLYDAVLEAMTMVRVAGGRPDFIAIHPNDWGRLAVIKAGSGADGEYYSGGPYRSPDQRLWGSLQEVQTTAAPEGTPLVGDSNGAKVYRRGGLSVVSTNSDQDDFIKNLITIRAEMRLVIGVTYPERFVEVVFAS